MNENIGTNPFEDAFDAISNFGDAFGAPETAAAVPEQVPVPQASSPVLPAAARIASSPAPNPTLDLGSEDTAPDFPADEIDSETDSEDEEDDDGAGTALAADFSTLAEIENPIAAALDAYVVKSIFSALPVFEHGSVTEDIEDITQTFDALRTAKAEDFPELEDGNRVTWNVTYGKITKVLPYGEAKKKKIGEFKASIEASKEFMDALKKSKDKNPRFVIKPRVTAQNKGDSKYKGVFTNAETAAASGKVISIIPAFDGFVYETRREEIGTFTTRIAGCRELSEVKAGFIPALPRVPQAQLLEIVSFFRAQLREDGNFEAIANVLWDKERELFCTYIPQQSVTRATAIANLDDVPDSSRYLHYMDIHSHNVMAARFSKTDDNDEKATRVYAVFGRLDKFLPEVNVRISNGGKYLPIDPEIVFEPFERAYPEVWNTRVTVRGDTEVFAA